MRFGLEKVDPFRNYFYAFWFVLQIFFFSGMFFRIIFNKHISLLMSENCAFNNESIKQIFSPNTVLYSFSY